MKSMIDCDYYELLEVSQDASKLTIQEAYQTSCSLFAPDSIVSYNFLSGEEREKLFQRFHKAYETLMNDQKRIEYDKKMFNRAGEWYRISKQSFSYSGKNTGNKKGGAGPEIVLEDYKDKNGHISLEKLREDLGFQPEDISNITRIRPPMIHALEKREFRKLPPATYIKGYLKSYADCLGLDAETLIQAYGSF